MTNNSNCMPTDLFNNEIEVGDYVIYPIHNNWDRPKLRCGKVTKINYTPWKDYPTSLSLESINTSPIYSGQKFKYNTHICRYQRAIVIKNNCSNIVDVISKLFSI